MKKSTLLVLLLAAALGGYVYYTEFRHPAEKTPEGAPKPLYTFASDDIVSISLTRPGESAPVVLEQRKEGWTMTSPISTRVDRTNVESLANSLARAASNRSMPADPARMKEFGLLPPAASVEVRLKNGQTQKLELGSKDFTGMDVYAHQGGSKDVQLVPDAVLTEATRPVLELRDRAVLDMGGWAITELDIRTPKTRFRLERKGADWDMAEPRQLPADSDEIGQLTNSLSSARFTDVVEEQAKDAAAAAKYGLNAPQVAVDIRNEQGGEASLVIGKKDESKYFARDAGRSLVFHVEDALVKKFLDASLESLRDKHLLRSKADEYSQIIVRNEHQTMKATAGTDGKWQVEEPAALKGKAMNTLQVFEPLNNSKATEVMDHPPADIVAKLSKPAVEIKLTDKKGAVTTVAVSAKDGKAVYARSSASPAIFKMDQYFLVRLNFLAAQVAP